MFCPAHTLYPYFLAQATRHPVVGCRRCTNLTALDLAASGDPGEYTCNVPAGITVLQRLQHLGLRHCVAGPLPRSMCQMTQLTSLTVTRHVSNSTDLLFRDANGLVVSFVVGSAVARVHPCSVTQQLITPHPRVWLSCLFVPAGRAGQHCRASVHKLLSLLLLQPLPPLLQALDASAAFAEVLYKLTALKHLSLDNIVEYHASGETLDLSMLVQLTFLELNWAGNPQLMAFKGCTGLRTLHLIGARTLHVLSCTLREHSSLERLHRAAHRHTG